MHRSAGESSIVSLGAGESRLYYTGPVSKLTALSVIISLSFPAIISLLSDFLVETINIFYIGRLTDPVLLSAIGLATSVLNVSYLGLMYGMSSSLETLCSQSFGRHDNYLCGLFLNKARFILPVCSIIPSLILFFAEPLLNLLGIEPIISKLTGNYVRYLIPFLQLLLQFDMTKRFIAAQNKFKISTVVALITTALHVFWDYLFVIYFDFGLFGAAISNCITWTLDFVLLTGYIQFSDVCGESWFFPNYQSFTNWIEFLKVGIPSSVTLALEWIALEILVFEAGHLGIVSLAANAAALNMLTFLYQIPSAISLTACVLVGMSIGACTIPNAKTYSKMIVTYVIILMGIILGFIAGLNHYIAYIYSNDEDVVIVLSKIIPLVCLYEFFDSIQGSLNGIIRGQGNVKITAIGNFTAYYLILQPFALFFAFYLKWDIIGLWIGAIIGVACVGLFYSIFLLNINWESLLLSDKAFAPDEIPISFINESIEYYNRLNNSMPINTLNSNLELKTRKKGISFKS